MEFLLKKMADYFFATMKEQRADELLIGNDETGEVEKLLSDIEHNPYALLMSFIVDDNQIDGKPERLPYEIKKIFGNIDFSTLESIKLVEWKSLLLTNKLTNNPEKDGENLFNFIILAKQNYYGDISKIWSDHPSSEVLIQRLIAIPGFTVEKANMFAYLLVIKFNIVLNDYTNINVTNDHNIRNTMVKIGLINKDASYEEIKEICKKINPEFPGLFDSFFWMIGEYAISVNKIPSSDRLHLDEILLDSCKKGVDEIWDSGVIGQRDTPHSITEEISIKEIESKESKIESDSIFTNDELNIVEELSKPEVNSER